MCICYSSTQSIVFHISPLYTCSPHWWRPYLKVVSLPLFLSFYISRKENHLHLSWICLRKLLFSLHTGLSVQSAQAGLSGPDTISELISIKTNIYILFFSLGNNLTQIEEKLCKLLPKALYESEHTRLWFVCTLNARVTRLIDMW